MTNGTRDRWYVAAWDSEVDHAPPARTGCGMPFLFSRSPDLKLRAFAIDSGSVRARRVIERAIVGPGPGTFANEGIAA